MVLKIAAQTPFLPLRGITRPYGLYNSEYMASLLAPPKLPLATSYTRKTLCAIRIMSGGLAMDARRALVHLNETERDCVLRYVSFLSEQLGENLVQIWLFGSAARGDMWADWMPMHSDIDILILSNRSVPHKIQEELLNETYPLFLECGRQISPQFRTMAQFHSPEDERTREFFDRVRAEGHVIYENDNTQPLPEGSDGV